MHPARQRRLLRSKLALDEVVVIERLFRQAQITGVSFPGPAGLFVRAAFRACLGAFGNIGAAGGTGPTPGETGQEPPPGGTTGSPPARRPR